MGWFCCVVKNGEDGQASAVLQLLGGAAQSLSSAGWTARGDRVPADILPPGAVIPSKRSSRGTKTRAQGSARQGGWLHVKQGAPGIAMKDAMFRCDVLEAAFPRP